MHCRSTLLFLVIAAQIALLVWVHRASKIMREEWPRVVKASPARVYVIQHERFWGPVNALVPKRCREMDKWQKITDTENEAPTLVSPASPSPVLSSLTAVEPGNSSAPLARVDYAAEELAAESQAMAVVSTTVWQDQQPGVPAPAPPFLAAGAVPEGPGRPPPQPTASTTAWVGPAPAEASTTLVLQTVQTVQTLMQTAAQNTDPVTKQALLSGAEDVPQEEMLRSQQGTAGLPARRLAAHRDHCKNCDVVVQRCNETMHFDGVSHLHRYLSMISLSNHITGGTPTAEELHKGRLRGHDALLVGIIICMILKYSLKVTDILAECCGHQYVQLWNQGRTTFDKFLESLMLHGPSIVFTLAMQMTLCSLFLTFWREDHFIMTYIPGLGFSLFFGSLVVFCLFMVADRLRGWMVRCKNSYIYCFWFIWVLWMLLFTVPMIGYCVYSVNFLWRVREMGWLQDQDEMFSKEFVHASVSVARASGCFVVVSVVDMAVILLLDFDQHKSNFISK